MSFLLLMAICCSFVVVPAGAETTSVSSNVSFVLYTAGTYLLDCVDVKSGSFSIPRSMSTSIYRFSQSFNQGMKMKPGSFRVDSTELFYSGSIGLYMSFYISSESGYYFVSEGSYSSPSSWKVEYYNQDNNVGSLLLTDSDISTFTPNIDSNSISTIGYRISCEIPVDEVYGAGRPSFSYIGTSETRLRASGGGSGGVLIFCVPSMSMITNVTSAELEEMESIANGIAQTNNVLSAMYGDIMSVLNSIYQRTGDMLAAQQLTNQYLVSMSNYLQQIAGNTSNIYTLLSTYMHYLQEISETADDIYAELQAFHSTFLLKVMELIGTVQTESDDIQAKMEELYERLEEWLNTAFQDAVNEDLAGEVEGVQGDMSQSESIESGVTGSMSSAFAGLDLSGFSFSSGMIAGISYVSNTWTSFYNSLGDYQIIVLLPLYIGVGLLVLGYSHKIIVHASRKKDGGG